MNISTERAGIAFLLGASMLLPSLVFAQDLGVSASVNAQATTSVRTTLMQNAVTRAGQEIDRRIAALQRLNARIQEMRKVTAEFKQNLNTNIQNQVSGLTTLRAKIEADTDAATLKADVQTIGAAYRVFMLIMPQAAIAAAADRVVVAVDMLVGIGNKLQARIDAAAQTGADGTALKAALTDLGAKLSTAQTEAQAAVTGSAALAPDNGDAKVMASNTSALKAARTHVQDAHAALIAARKDVTTILQGLRSINVNATTTVQVQ
ncbi:MAG: hypothetical protein AAB449_02040 [Patescibacteria group bacterium]